MLLVKIIVLVLLVFVIISLFSGLYFLVKDKGQSNRTVNALTMRIGLSVVAIIVVLIAGVTGILEINPSPLDGNATVTRPSSEGALSDEASKPGSGRRPIQSGN